MTEPFDCGTLTVNLPCLSCHKVNHGRIFCGEPCAQAYRLRYDLGRVDPICDLEDYITGTLWEITHYYAAYQDIMTRIPEDDPRRQTTPTLIRSYGRLMETGKRSMAYVRQLRKAREAGG